jgi:uncharacterized protein
VWSILFPCYWQGNLLEGVLVFYKLILFVMSIGGYINVYADYLYEMKDSEYYTESDSFKISTLTNPATGEHLPGMHGVVTDGEYTHYLYSFYSLLNKEDILPCDNESECAEFSNKLNSYLKILNIGELKYYIFMSVYYDNFWSGTHGDECTFLLEHYAYNKNDTSLIDSAVKLVKSMSGHNYTSCQYALGMMKFHGIGVPKNNKDAVYWFRKAAENGHAAAQNALGYRLYNGLGVSKDINEATFWYRKSAEQGYPAAQHSLGNKYNAGEGGVPQDKKEAVSWYLKAATKGYSKAQASLGIAYYVGSGVRQDYTEALAWLRKASDQGEAQASHIVGIIYLKGQGVLKNDYFADKFFLEACKNGREESCK